MDTAGTVLAVAGGCRAVEPRGMHLIHPVHVAFVTVAHGRLEAPMDRIGLLVAMGLWPKRCVAGTARLDFAGSEPAGGMGGLLPHCRRIAALPLRDRGAVRSPRGGLPSVGTSPWPMGNRVWPVGAALAGVPGSRLRGCRRAGGRRRPRYASCHMALAASSRAGAAYGCPGSGVGAPLLWRG